MTTVTTERCDCGHVIEAHDIINSGDTWPCAEPGCPCLDWHPEEGWEEQ